MPASCPSFISGTVNCASARKQNALCLLTRMFLDRTLANGCALPFKTISPFSNRTAPFSGGRGVINSFIMFCAGRFCTGRFGLFCKTLGPFNPLTRGHPSAVHVIGSSAVSLPKMLYPSPTLLPHRYTIYHSPFCVHTGFPCPHRWMPAFSSVCRIIGL